MTRLFPLSLLFLAVATIVMGLAAGGGVAQEVVRNCAICHGKQSYKRLVRDTGEMVDMFVDEKVLARSAHYNRTCTDCHADIATVPHEDYRPLPVGCTRCHYLGNPVGAPQSDIYQAYAESVHGRALVSGSEKAPRCQDCHGTHDIRPVESPASMVSHFEVAGTCAPCHRQAFDDYRLSAHGTSVYDSRSQDAPSCIDCHGEHNIFAHDDPRSKVYLTKVADDCARCHEAIEIVGKYGVPTGQIKTYRKSFHGIAVRFGSKYAANCSSCHGHHKVLPSSDPASSIHKDNIPKTCGQEGCHEGAGTNFAIGKVHVDPEAQESGLVYYVSTFFRYFTFVVILGLVIHIVLDLGRRFLGPKDNKRKEEKHEGEG